MGQELRRVIFIEIFKKYKAKTRERELYKLVKLIERRRPLVVLELGVATGGTLKFWQLLMGKRKKTIVIGIDHKLYEDRTWEFNRTEGVAFLRMDIHRSETVEAVQRLLGTRKIDFLFIDESHTYEAVKDSFERFLPLMQGDGVVAFHDIRTPLNPDYPKSTVGKFYEELKQKYKTKDIILASTWRGSDGIGVVFLG